MSTTINPATQYAFQIETTGPWDPAKQVKRWADKNAVPDASGNVTYPIIGSFGVGTLTIPLAVALVANIPPQHIDYPQPSLGLSVATSAGQQIAELYLSSEADAKALMAALGIPGVPSQPSAPSIAWNAETRREWQFLLGGTVYNVGTLLYERDRNGVGRPGAWTQVNGVPVWMPLSTNATIIPSGPEMAIPLKPGLDKLYQIQQTLGGWVFVDTSGDVPAVASGGVGIAPADLAALLQGAKDSAAIKAWFRIP